MSITDRPIRIAILGTGRISGKHLEAIAVHAEDLELVGACDTNEAALASADLPEGTPTFDCLETMLKETSPDIVTICTPSGLHPDHAIRCAKAGVHVMSEKPMATHWQDGLDMVKACEDGGVRLFVVKQNRLNATLQLLKRAVDSGRFGQIYMVNINVFWTRPQEYYDADDWRGTRDLDGGAFMNQASHYIDLLDWLIGPIDAIHAITATLERKIEMEDTGIINVRWKDGGLGSVNVTMLTYPKNLEGSITILGQNGSVRVGGVAVNEIQEWSFADEHPDDASIREASYETGSVYGFGHPPYYRNVIEALRGEAEAMTDGQQGLNSLELLIAAYRSAETGEMIHLPLER
ncbi:MAG: Gfo/Idh/MocA family oxidoreductase [Planctomycetota bacterium]|nr:Gfo/Idh/MocA family oxidoreductase [Planctomycetota bacterium]